MFVEFDGVIVFGVDCNGYLCVLDAGDDENGTDEIEVINLEVSVEGICMDIYVENAVYALREGQNPSNIEWCIEDDEKVATIWIKPLELMTIPTFRTSD